MITKIRNQNDVRGLISVFSKIWGEDTLSELISSINNTECVLALDGSDVVGYAFYGLDDRTSAIEITDIGVDPQVRKSGYGQKLIDYFCTLNSEIRLTVRCDNVAALALYEKNDFTLTSTYQNYYGVCCDGYRMVRR